MTDHHDGHDHDDHGHSHYDTPGSRRARSRAEVRAMALEAALVEQGVITTDAIDLFTDAMEHRFGPHHGARVVARAWTDPEFKALLLTDANAAVAALGIGGLEGNIRVVENTDDVHHMVVCTLCSCYPHSVIGVPPAWYKSASYRARAVREPRVVLAEFGVALPEEVEVRVWDSTSELRYLVLPQRPSGTDGWDAEALAALVTRNSMIGTERDLTPRAGAA